MWNYYRREFPLFFIVSVEFEWIRQQRSRRTIFLAAIVFFFSCSLSVTRLYPMISNWFFMITVICMLVKIDRQENFNDERICYFVWIDMTLVCELVCLCVVMCENERAPLITNWSRCFCIGLHHSRIHHLDYFGFRFFRRNFFAAQPFGRAVIWPHAHFAAWPIGRVSFDRLHLGLLRVFASCY